MKWFIAKEKHGLIFVCWLFCENILGFWMQERLAASKHQREVTVEWSKWESQWVGKTGDEDGGKWYLGSEY